MPLGSHQCFTCSAFVHASKTTCRGKPNFRVMVTKRSEASVTFAPSPAFEAAVLSSVPTRFLPFHRLRPLVQLAEVLVQAGELALPEASVEFEPLIDVLQRGRDDGSGSALSV